MPRVINLFLLIVGVVATGVGIVQLRGDPPVPLGLPIGAGLILLAWISDKRRQKRVDDRRRTALADRTAELTSAPWGSQQSLQVPGSSWAVVPALLIVVLTGGWAALEGLGGPRVAWDIALAGVVTFLAGSFLLARAMAGFGRPVLELSTLGFVVPIHGRIFWRDVSGIHLWTMVHRGATSHILRFRVEQYSRIVKTAHWTERLLAPFHVGALGRGIIGVQLRTSGEKPETVYAVARFLWKQATGNSYDWDSEMSDPFNQALRRTSALASSCEAADALEQATREHPQKSLHEMEQVARDVELMVAERSRQLITSGWSVGAVLVVTLLVFAWPWLKTIVVR